MFSEAILPRYDPILPYPIIPSTEADKSYPNNPPYFNYELSNINHNTTKNKSYNNETNDVYYNFENECNSLNYKNKHIKGICANAIVNR